MNKNHEARTLAYKSVKFKVQKIKELGIGPVMDPEPIDQLIIKLSKAKAKEDGSNDWTTFVKGQRWYVNSLIEFSGLTPKEMLDAEYENSFGEVASEAEMLAKIEDML